MSTKLDSHRVLILYLLIILLILFSFASYYFYKPINEGRSSAIIGDGICGNLLNEIDQDRCCAEAHEGDAVIACLGEWKYLSGYNKCYYLCEGALPSCTEESKLCDNGVAVSRNASKECNFDSC